MADPPRYAPPTLIRPPPAGTATPPHGNQPPAAPSTAAAAGSMVVAVVTPGRVVVPRLLPALRVRGGEGGRAERHAEMGKETETREPQRPSPAARKGSKAGAFVRRQGVGDEERRQPPTKSAEDQRWSALVQLKTSRLAPPGHNQLCISSQHRHHMPALCRASTPATERPSRWQPPLRHLASTRSARGDALRLPPCPPPPPPAHSTTPNFPRRPPPPPPTLRLPLPESLRPRTSMCGRSFFAL